GAEERQRAAEEQPLEDLLEPVQVGDAAGVVLTPVPERERRVATELIAEGAVVEGGDGVPERRLEVEREERDHGRREEGDHEPETRANGAGVGVPGPEGQ